MLDGMLAFAEAYRGELVTETMPVRGINDDAAHLADVASFLAQLRPAKAYLAVPTRPPAAPWAEPPLENVINQAFQLLRARLEQTELLIGYEGNACAGTGESAEDLLGITAVHPMREDAVQEFLVKAGAEMSVVQALVAGGQLVETSFDRHKFYSRRVKGVSVHE